MVKGQIFTKRPYFRLIQIESICRRQNKCVASKKLKFALGKVENVVEKGENARHQHFLLFPQCFQKASFFFKAVKECPGLCGKGLNSRENLENIDFD